MSYLKTTFYSKIISLSFILVLILDSNHMPTNTSREINWRVVNLNI